jgi:hypothetical protein
MTRMVSEPHKSNLMEQNSSSEINNQLSSPEILFTKTDISITLHNGPKLDPILGPMKLFHALVTHFI